MTSSNPSAASCLNKVYRRVDAILDKTSPLEDNEQTELQSLGRLAATLDDLRYRRVHSSAGYSKADEKKAKKK